MIYDPSGRDLLEGEYFCADDAIMNIAFESYEDGPLTAAGLDDVARKCQRFMREEVEKYKHEGGLMGYYQQEAEADGEF